MLGASAPSNSGSSRCVNVISGDAMRNVYPFRSQVPPTLYKSGGLRRHSPVMAASGPYMRRAPPTSGQNGAETTTAHIRARADRWVVMVAWPGGRPIGIGSMPRG
jgi:hypothetical protein